MTSDGGRPTPDPIVSSFWIFISLGGLAACLTLLYLGMRAVMDIGGSCASGGPFEIARPCPAGVPVVMTIGIPLGVVLAGIYVWQCSKAKAPSFIGLAWPALFLSLGWNFLDYGIDPPVGEGLVWGWLICGVIFFLMGGLPLLVVAGPTAKGFFVEEADSPGANPLAGMGARRRSRTIERSTAAPASASATRSTSVVDLPGDGGEGDGLVGRLERLAALHRTGALSDDEYEAAKQRLLTGRPG